MSGLRAGVVAWVVVAVTGASEQQEAYLEALKAMLPKSEAWESWLAHTGELPPDFDALPSIPWLPNPLTEGPAGKIASAEEWRAQRETLKALFHTWVIGSVPPEPETFDAEVTEVEAGPGARVRDVTLRFGPENQAHVSMRIAIPPGDGAFPVFLTQDNHAQWSNIALQRGYVTCTFAGADSKDDTASFIDAYPDADWSKLTRRAWAASRCIDYLITLREVNAEQIAITGHSRNGKQALIAAALDERIACVISSSSGAGGPLSARYYGEHYFGEGIENITRQFPDWFHPRFRFFVGREDKLPVDLHQLVALSAPRPCLLSIAVNDNVESSWAMQHTYNAVKPVYDLFGEVDNVKIMWRAGGHETWPTIIERYMDWCDLHFGRGDYTFDERYVYPHDWEAWNDNATQVTFTESMSTRDAVEAMMGTAPHLERYATGSYGELRDYEAEMLRRASAPTGVELERVTFGDYINGDVYAPAGRRDDQKYPAILWLPGMCPSTGYLPAYRRGDSPHVTFARAGYAVMAYDPIGTGRRVEETENFYARYPDWSLLGKMVRDAQAALDAMGDVAYIDPERIYVVGYHVGAFVAAHLAAVDDRPAGYALVSPPPRFDSSEFATRLWSRELMLLPRLERHRDNVPYDATDLMSAIAPKQLLLVTATLDRHCPPSEGDALAEAYGRSEGLSHQSPRTYNHFDESVQRVVVSWLNTR